MHKNLLKIMAFLIVLVAVTATAFTNHKVHPLRSFQPPEGYTGTTPGVYCADCHGGNALNNFGGSVNALGLPVDTYTPGAQYTFSITTTHSAADRRRWGFSIAARNSLDEPVGTFSSTNPNVGINGSELSHLSAVTTVSNQSSYTYTNLRWTAPAAPSAADQTITFYYVGNATNNSGNTIGDFVYAKKVIVTYTPVYTFTGNGNWNVASNWSNNLIPPATISGNAEIIIDPVVGGECVLNVEQHVSATAKITVVTGKNMRIEGGLIINN
ncbi:MAG: choice-of-anchor V domain-containing protein [Ferruginibacter sp.]